MDKEFNQIFDLSTISPTPITTPRDPYLEWLLDMYGITLRRSSTHINPPMPPEPPIGEEYYYYLGTDGMAYADSNGNLYTWKEND